MDSEGGDEMKASVLIEKLQEMTDEHGDLDVIMFDDGWSEWYKLTSVEQSDYRFPRVGGEAIELWGGEEIPRA